MLISHAHKIEDKCHKIFHIKILQYLGTYAHAEYYVRNV